MYIRPEGIAKFMELKDGWAENPRIGAMPQERGGVIRADQITGSFPEWDLFLYLENLKKCFRYTLKDLDGVHCAALGIDYRDRA